MAIDDIDRRILGALTREGRLTWLALADDVGLSPSATTERVRRLERAGVITGYHARVASAAVGVPMEAWIAVTLGPDTDRSRFVAGLRGEVAVVDAVHLTGPVDYELRVRCADTGHLDRLLAWLKADLGVAATHTRIVLDRVLGPDDVRLGPT